MHFLNLQNIFLSLFVNQEKSCDLQRGQTDSGQLLLMMNPIFICLLFNYFICKNKKRRKVKGRWNKSKGGQLIQKSSLKVTGRNQFVFPLCKSQDCSWFTKRDRNMLANEVWNAQSYNCTNSNCQTYCIVNKLPISKIPNSMYKYKGKLNNYWLCQKNNLSHNFKLSPKSTRAAQSQRYQKLSKRIWKDIKVQNAVNKVHRKTKYAEKN